MRLLLCFICPPIAVLLCGKPITALLNLALTFCLIVPGIIHALAVVNDHKANKRNNKLIRTIENNNPNRGLRM